MQTDRVHLMTAMRRGFANRCPNCNRGRIFGRYLRVNTHCGCCGTALRRKGAAYNAELAPAFVIQSLVSVPVGLAAVAIALHSDRWPWVEIIGLILGSIMGSVALLQPVKGAILAMQWAMRLDDFA